MCNSNRILLGGDIEMREIKFELIWNNGTPKRIVTLDEINDMGEEYQLVAYQRQYTGLKDKNGKEVFEGDIVGFNWCNKYTLNQVIWDNKLFHYTLKEISVTLGYANDIDDGFNLTIKGNIYENANLLN